MCEANWIMKIVSWNVRGLSCSTKRSFLKYSLRSIRAELILLQETKIGMVDDKLVRSLKPFKNADCNF